MVKSAFNIAEYAQSSSKVGFVMIAHKLANRINCMRNIGPGHSLVEQITNYPPENKGIIQGRPTIHTEFVVQFRKRIKSVSIIKSGLSDQIDGIFTLMDQMPDLLRKNSSPRK